MSNKYLINNNIQIIFQINQMTITVTQSQSREHLKGTQISIYHDQKEMIKPKLSKIVVKKLQRH